MIPTIYLASSGALIGVLAMILISGGGDADLDADADLGDSEGGALDLLGLRGVPLTLAAGSLLLIFSAAGVTLSLLAPSVPLIASVAASGAAAILGAGRIGRAFVRLIPSMETSATNLSRVTRMEGVVIGRDAAPGAPALTRLEDGRGGTHDLLLEPRSDEVIPSGSAVVAIRVIDPETGDHSLKLILK